MTKRNSKGKEILFKRVFAWSYIPENAKGLLVLGVLALPVLFGVVIINLIESVMGGVNLDFLQILIVALGLIAIQLFAARHS